MIKKTSLVILAFATSLLNVSLKGQTNYHEMYRPQIHFSPEANWMNDPNGMFYYKGVYHLFYQHYPAAPVWGPMHWGHATSHDLIHWQQQPVALRPDSIGYIFSGSAVVDKHNTSGFGENGAFPMVAIFTQHDTAREKAHKNDSQNQSIAYSLDKGATWAKYPGNPVLQNPGITDFRDPKVMWYEPRKRWIMTLAAKDRVTFYSSPDLKSWRKESEFGNGLGAHGGVWECPDLFVLKTNEGSAWVLLVSINPGGPNGGSATQYFVGQFDGSKFTPNDSVLRWVDYGADDYAGVTWSNTGKEKIFMGWMSNWLYANKVPSTAWRGAGTLPRKLALRKMNGSYFLASQPIKEINSLITYTKKVSNSNSFGYCDTVPAGAPFKINLSTYATASFSIIVSNTAGEKIVIGYDKEGGQYYIDRSGSGKTEFVKGFAGKHVAPRISRVDKIDMSIFVDASSVELFADGGLTVMTDIVFPSKPYEVIKLQPDKPQVVQTFTISKLKSIW